MPRPVRRLRPAAPGAGHFVTHFTGQDDRRFATLQGAMDLAAELPRPTGTIVYVPESGADDRAVARFRDGEIELVGGHRSPAPRRPQK